jgi:hypothetical protein
MRAGALTAREHYFCVKTSCPSSNTVGQREASAAAKSAASNQDKVHCSYELN